MSKELIICGKTIRTPIAEILKILKSELTNGKLQTIYDERNNEITVTCPHHKFGKEGTPSCNIYVGDSKPDLKYGTVHCFSCHFKGSFSHFIAECMEISIDDANAWLLSHFESNSDSYIDFNFEPIELESKTPTKYLDESILDNFQS